MYLSVSQIASLLQNRLTAWRAVFHPRLEINAAIANGRNWKHVLNAVGMSFSELPQSHRPRPLCLTPNEISETVSNQAEQAIAFHSLGRVYAQAAAYLPAKTCFIRAQAIYVATGDFLGEAAIATALAKVYLQLGEPFAALYSYHEALELYQGLGDRLNAALTLKWLAAIYQQQGLLLSAYACYQDAIALFEIVGNTTETHGLIEQLNQIYENMGRPDCVL